MNVRMSLVGGLAALCVVCLALYTGGSAVAQRGKEEILLQDKTLLQDSGPKRRQPGNLYSLESQARSCIYATLRPANAGYGSATHGPARSSR
jgi:hypothetical protein